MTVILIFTEVKNVFSDEKNVQSCAEVCKASASVGSFFLIARKTQLYIRKIL